MADGRGRPPGATLGNDVHRRDFEGRSALLPGKAQDNDASCASGPFIRLFDRGLGMDDVRSATKAAPAWTFGVRALMRNLAERGLG